MKRVVCPHPIAEQFAAHIETIKKSRSVSGANNVWRHFNAFFLTIVARVGAIIETCDGSRRLRYPAGSDREADDPVPVVSERLRILLPEEATSIIGEAFAGKQRSAIYNAAADIRTFFRWAVGLKLATLDPEKVQSPLDEQDSLAISQAWLNATYRNKGTRATRKTQFRLFFLAVAARENIDIDIGKEARAYEALRRAAGQGRRSPDDRSESELSPPSDDLLAGTVTERICHSPSECVRIFRNTITQSESRAAILESLISTVRRFYVWAHDQGFVKHPIRI